MKYAANALSVGRILILPALLFVLDHELWFVILYLAAGLTDVLDGAVARRTGTQSDLGARLDSIADLFLFALILFVLYSWTGVELLYYLPWLFAIVAVRLGNLALSLGKYRRVVFLHTWANKLTGMLIFCCPLIYLGWHRADYFWPVCALALLASVEEGLIHLTSRKPDLNRRSLLIRSTCNPAGGSRASSMFCM